MISSLPLCKPAMAVICAPSSTAGSHSKVRDCGPGGLLLAHPGRPRAAAVRTQLFVCVMTDVSCLVRVGFLQGSICF